ncbi:MAG: Fmu (Sun) domain-containing protein [Chitinophagaceae bacterium]|jgi:16S rRNA (cytosine967-C5)-methyltransferase|nr:Fmu (Sun) domain-containing protein [Chitinophagaceae bacterium]
MSRFHSYVNSAKEIITAYKGNEPFSSFIKKQFNANKKFGGKDRKQISHLCYCLFRIGKLFENVPIEERLLIALFLCSNETNAILANLKPEWNEQADLPLQQKLELLNTETEIKDLFPCFNELSADLDADAFAWSHLQQPDLFLRIRPGQQERVMSKLETAGITFQTINETCLALPNTTKLDEVLLLNKEAVVQDLSSQGVSGFLQTSKTYFPKSSPARIWDCCAASGGKSIMAYDLLPGIELTVSDIRNSILVNLQSRFEEAGIKKYNSFVADLSDPSFVSHHSSYDLIITDVPCTGSGTWGRTPEQLCFFDETKIDEYAALQKKITANVIPYIRKEGLLLYITCSVFKKENEEAVDFICATKQMKLIESSLLQGYHQKADTMFAALFKKV